MLFDSSLHPSEVGTYRGDPSKRGDAKAIIKASYQLIVSYINLRLRRWGQKGVDVICWIILQTIEGVFFIINAPSRALSAASNAAQLGWKASLRYAAKCLCWVFPEMYYLCRYL